MVGCEGPLEVGRVSSRNRGPPRCCHQGEIRLHGWMSLMALRLWMEKAGFTLAFGKQNGAVHRHPGTCPVPYFISALLPLHPGLPLPPTQPPLWLFAFVGCVCSCLSFLTCNSSRSSLAPSFHKSERFGRRTSLACVFSRPGENPLRQR